jgi:hypothetical protein
MSLNFVAAEDGLEEDPQLLGVARALKVPRSEAYWFVMRLRRFVLNYGNHLTGAIAKKYGSEDIAAYLDWRGRADKLVDALRHAGYLGFKKGRGFFYPGWDQTITGYYAHRREADRRWHEADRKKRRNDGRANIDGASADASADGRSDIFTKTDSKEERKGEPAAPVPSPEPPPGGGDRGADARWAWLLENAPTPQNRERCVQMLGRLSDDDWALVQRAYGLARQSDAPISVKNKKVLLWPTDRFLSQQAFFRFRPPTTSKQKRPNGAPSAAAREALDEAAEKAAQAERQRRFLLELLADPDVDEREKERHRRAWLADPDHAGQTPPWVAVVPPPTPQRPRAQVAP